jgi:hypothetical protein
MYNYINKKSCTEPFRLIAYARKNSKRLLCGLFYGQIRVDLEVNMAIPLQEGQEKVKEIKVEGGREKEKEVIVRHEIVSSNWKTWNHDNFSRDWNKNYSA